MRTFKQSLVNFLQREDGPTAVEYAVMLALIVVVCITAITTLGTNARFGVPTRYIPPRRLQIGAKIRW